MTNYSNLEDVYELSPLQEGIYYHWLAETSSTLYFEQTSYRVRAKILDIEKLKRAYDRLTARHAVLRTSFSAEYAGRSLQIVRKEVPSNFTFEKLDNQADRQAQVALIKLKDRERGFDLSSGSQMRLHVIDLSGGEYEFIWSHHHILMDGWCVSVLINDFNELLSAETTGRKLNLAPALPYANYINWLRTIDRDSSLSYWKDYLSGYSALAEIPFKAQTADTSYVESVERLQIGGDLFKKVDVLCTQLGITQNTFVQAVWGYLLSRYNNTNDVVFGAVVSGRPADLPGVEDMIGLFSNTIPVRVQYDPDDTPVELLKSLQEQSIRSTSHHYMNLSEVQAQSELGNELMNHIMVFENYAVKELENEGVLNTHSDEGFSVASVEVIDQNNYDFNVVVAPSAVSLGINIRYNLNRYDESSLKSLMRHLDKLINAFAHSANQPLRTFDYLSEEEKHTLLVSYNDTAVAYPKDKTIVDLFEAQAARTPDNIAVVFAGKELTYRALDEKSNQLAHYLRANHHIQPDDLIGIQLERSEWMIIAMLGVLKAGGAYLPIDAQYPSSRKEYIVKDSALKLLITETSFLYDLDYYQGAVFAIDVEFDADNYLAEGLAKTHTPANLAYVIYTSGSTGKPKGVMVEHGAIANTILAQIDAFRVDANNKGLQFASFSFDASISEVFIILLSGARLLIAQESHRKDPALLTWFIRTNAIDIATLPPSFLSKIEISALKGLKTLITAGEAAHYPQAIEYLIYGTYYNAYGPTETSICATICKLGQPDQVWSNRIPIGKPIANTQIYILDEKQALQPVGVAGEIYIGGSGLARGYLNQGGLTQEKFIASPFKPGERLYKTGDLGRWLPDGNIEFVGRKDDQVKIRGYRIELGEIEQALLNHEAINQAVVLAKANQSGDKELVAYITANSAQNTNDLRVYLEQTLPAYMLPAHFVQLKAMPLTTSGKMDKKALPDPEGLGLTTGVKYVAPRNETEEKLVKIWQEVLQRENIGVNDDFFALGGHSLKAIRLSNEYQKELAAKLTLKELLAHTSLAAHAALIQAATREAFIQIEKVTPQASYPVSDAQRRLWVLSQFEGGSAAYNIPDSTYLNQDIDIENFKRAIDATIDRHEILRTVFREDASGEIRQWILDREDLGFAIDYQDFRNEADKQQKAQAYIAADAYQPFDLEKGPLLRAALLRVEEGEYIFYFNMHHIISDGWSMEVLSKDVFNYYQAYQAGKAPEVRELRIQYKDYSAWQLAQLDQESFKAHQAYWLDKLSGELPLLDLPGTKQRPNVKTYNGQSLATYLDKTTTAKLKDYIQQKGGSLFMGLLASWNVLMYRYSAQQDIIIGSPIAGREHADLEDQIGFYINMLALRNQVDPQESFDGFYQTLKEDTLKSYSHQMYPFDRLVEDLHLQRDTSRSAVFDVMLTLQNNGERLEELELSEEEINQTVDLSYRTAKFDLEIIFQEAGDYLSLQIIFNTDVYEKTMVEGLIRHYKQLLNALLQTPEKKISQIGYLSEVEKYQLLVTYNDTAVAYPKDKTIVDLFEAQAAKTPDHIAVVFEDTELTYQELNERSNQLAHYLRENYNIQPDDLVGIHLGRSEWMIIAILGVLKAGGAYVPIDPEYPQQRVEAIVEDSQCKVLLDAQALASFQASEQAYSVSPITSQAKSNNLAYVIYTSGSTGKPKGVMIEHRNVTNFFTGMTALFGEQPGTFLSMTHFTFDISVLELLWTLTKGYKVVIQADARQIVEQDEYMGEQDEYNQSQGSYSVYAQISKHQVTHLQVTPSMGAMLNQHLSQDQAWSSIKHILLGGEPATASLVNEIYQKLPHAQLYNMYGPTETTIWSTVKALEKDVERIAIGKPIANTRIYILDQNGKPVASGVQGEIYIGGAGVARGYTSKELTEGRFMESPFVAGDRLYRTGDYGSWLHDGSLYCSGRKDQQVKIRGYRIELGEIEQALEQHKEINQAVVLAKANESGDKELVAYITSKVEHNATELRAYLAETLPAYMLPAHFVQLEAMPLTTSGKVDKKSLPNPEGLGLASGAEYVAPRNETEKKVIEIWEMVLSRTNIGMNDDFFDLGGFSMRAIGLVAEYNKSFNVRVTLQELFKRTKVFEHAQIIEARIWLKTGSEEKTPDMETVEF